MLLLGVFLWKDRSTQSSIWAAIKIRSEVIPIFFFFLKSGIKQNLT